MTKAELESMLNKCNDKIKNIKKIKDYNLKSVVKKMEAEWDTTNGHDVVSRLEKNITNLENCLNDINKKIMLLKEKCINISYTEEMINER